MVIFGPWALAPFGFGAPDSWTASGCFFIPGAESSFPGTSMFICKNCPGSQTSKGRNIIKSVYSCKPDQRHCFIPGLLATRLKMGTEWNLVHVSYCKIFKINVSLLLSLQWEWIWFLGYSAHKEILLYTKPYSCVECNTFCCPLERKMKITS